MYNMIYKYNDLEILRLNSKKINQIMFYQKVWICNIYILNIIDVREFI